MTNEPRQRYRYTSRFLEMLSYVFFGSWVLIGAVAVYWYLEPLPLHYIEREVVTKNVPVGGQLVLMVTAVNSNRRCDINITRYIYDSIGKEHKFEQLERATARGYTVVLTIPPGAAIGPAKYIAVIEWWCNPLQHIWPRSITQEALGFEIAPASDDDVSEKFGLGIPPPLAPHAPIPSRILPVMR